MDKMFSHYIEWVARGVEIVGISLVLIGMAVALFRYVFDRGENGRSYSKLRRTVGKAILLGLEFLVAADIIATVVIEPTMESVLILGLIVLIRTFLSFSLEVELEGRWPWQEKKERRKHPVSEKQKAKEL